MATTASIGVAAAGLAGAIAWTAAGAGSAPSAQVTSIAADLDAKLRETSASVRARAETLAQMPRLEMAVATDATTVRDLTADELAFRPHANEHIEIAQIDRPDGRGGREGAAHRMLRLPDGGPPLPMGESGLLLIVDGATLHVAAIVAIEPRARANEVRGAVGVAQVVDLSSFAPRLRGLGLSAQLNAQGGSLSLGGVDGRRGETMSVALAEIGRERAQLVVSGLPPPPSRLRFLGPFALLALSTGVARVLKRRKPSAEALPAPAAALTLNAPGNSARAPGEGVHPAAELVHAAARDQAGTAVPIDLLAETMSLSAPVTTPGTVIPFERSEGTIAAFDRSEKTVVASDPDVQSLLSSASGANAGGAASPVGTTDLPELPSPIEPEVVAANTLPSSLFQARATPPAPVPPAAPNEPLDRQYRALFAEFVKLRQTCREPIDDLDPDRFVAVLRWKRDELMRAHRVPDVAFRLGFHNGRAVIRIPPPPPAPPPPRR